MDESEDNMSTEDVRSVDSPLSVKNKPKKRSLVERELETNLTARVTSPVTSEGTSTSRYGRARKLKTQNDLEAEKVMKPLRIDTKTQPQAYKMHASNSPIRKESPKRAPSAASNIENQIENIYNENMSLSRFGSVEDPKSQSPAKKFTKIYIRKDLIQKPDTDTVMLIKNMFSPVNNSTHLNNILERSSEKYTLNSHGKPRNGFPDTSSVVKTLDFDGKKKKENKEKTVAKNELFELEATCDYQVGDLAWARVGTYPFWPCIVTREPFTDMFVKKKLFGRVEHSIIHVTFFGDNGRRGWIGDNMLRKFHGRTEFETARNKFTPEAKKKDPRLYAAHFVSEKKLPLWNVSVDEAETLMREPKRLRIDVLYDMLEKARTTKTTPKREKSGKITRTDSDVSLSESLYDTLFSEDDGKADENKRIKKPKTKSLDVSEVVTACLDNMAAKSGIINIQKQSHMDRWLQKAKSKTPEKTQPKILVKTEREKRKDRTKKKSKEARKAKLTKNESLSSEKNLLPYQNEHDYSSVNYENHDINDSSYVNTDFEGSGYDDMVEVNGIGVIAKVESLANSIEDCSQDDIITTIVNDDIIINDSETVHKVEGCGINVIPERTKENVSDNYVSNLENGISSYESGQIESKVELPLHSNVISNHEIPIRRSKRKRQSNVERSTRIVEKSKNEKSKLESVGTISKTDIDMNLSDRNFVNSDTDHRDNLLDRDKKDLTEHNIHSKKEKSVVSEVGKDLSADDKESNQSNLIPLKDQSAVVLIDPVVSEEDTSTINKEIKQSDLLPLNGSKAVIVVSEVPEETLKENKEYNESAFLPLERPKAEIVIDSVVSEASKETPKKNKKPNQFNLLPLIGSKKVIAIGPVVSKVAREPSKQNKKHNESELLLSKGPKAEVVIDPVVSEVSKETSKRNTKSNQSDLLALTVSKEAIAIDPVVLEVSKETPKKYKRLNESDLLSSNDPKAEVVVEPVASKVAKDTSKQNKEHNQVDVLPLSGPRAVVVLEPVASKVAKDTSKQNKERNHFDLLPLNGPRAVVVIEPLKIEAFESRKIVKQSKEKDERAKLCNINEGDVAQEKATPDFSVLRNDDNVSQNTTNPTSGTDMVESVAKTVEKVINPNDMLPALPNEVKNKNSIHTEKKAIDNTNLPQTNEKDQNKNIEIEGMSCELKKADFNLPTSNLERKLNDAVGPLKTAANVVIGEEMYVFDRTLSQDYDDIEPESCDDASNLVIGPSNDEAIEKETVCGLNNALKYERTLSTDYDEVNEANDIETKNIFDQIQGNLTIDDQNRESGNEIDTKTGTDDVESNIQVVHKDSVHKNKEKIDEQGLEFNTVSELINDEGIPLFNGGKWNIANETIRGSGKKADTQNETEAPKAEAINDNTDKKLKSPKLSLNRLKNKVTNEKVTDVQNDTKSPKSTFPLTTSVQDKIVSAENMNQTNSPCKGLDFEMLIDMEATKVRSPKINGFITSKESSPDRKLKEEFDADTASMKSEDSGVSITKRKIRSKEKQDLKKALDDPEFLKYLEFRQDALIDEHPELTQDEIVSYLYQTWLYEESHKSDRKKTDDAEQSNLVKGLNQEPPPQPKKIKKKPKVEKEIKTDIRDLMPKEKPKRKATQSKPYYNEEFSDLEEEDLETFSIFDKDVIAQNEEGEEIDEVELYFEKLTKPKPNVFKGYVREKVCEICETTGNLVKCKSCHGTFHVDCVKKEELPTIEMPGPTRGRKKKKKPRGRRPKGYDESLMDSESQSDERSQDANNSEELNMSIDDELESLITVDAANFEAQFELKMKELQAETSEDFVSDQEIYWDAPPGQCEIVDVKQKEKPIDYSDYKCNNCEKYETPICFVCKSNKSPKTLTEARQKCQVAHCHRYYHLECLEYWPQTQFNSWEPSKTNKKVIEYIEALSCPRHVCHTCVSDDPRGCKTRFSGDKLARCVKCPATYHSFTKCLPAGTQILTGSQIICPRHYEHRAGKVPCHVNTGWCFICALGGTLICCEYCPTSFHAECLNIKPPEGSYMCEDCETGRLPLYGEMVWVKLGHYRWWPGIVLHPTEIPDNIMAVKHSPGEFVVRFFGQYDHYWVNRGRVFPFQEGDSGKISSQKSKIDAAFTTAMEHAQRACEILKNVEPNEEEEEDIASSLLPPHYVKLKVNKPVGSLTARRDIDANSLTQCDCDPKQPDPCGPYSHCLNRMLLTECGPLCRAGERCNNRAFERRDYPRLAAYRTPQRGWGLRTLEDIKQGQFVIEYVGELIDEEEFRRRMCRKHEIRDENFYFLTLDKERMIDAGPKGNLARFMNHCCEPNCETQKWTVLGDVRVGLFALRDIPANSEVTFNYNLECAGIEKKRCLCGAKRCSGYIGAKPKQEEAQPKKLKGPGKRTYKKRKHAEESPSTSKTKPPIKIKIVKTVKPRELTEIEKDLLIIKSATNGMSSDSDSRLSVDEKKDPKALKRRDSRLSDEDKKDAKALKRKRVSFSTEEVFSSSVKKIKLADSEID